ncbi:hypothetical protein CO670_17385 [Rhizobium sp. J15]|uniref:hypothetical protein n=1 Tax=Rhizobium sp. J15 TaxID=2035450 RepID=UPI000BE92B4D|nr:hypothetical protein [Rhizobium sp. J15]PDT15544.1 hypothetical protein CO670_17385 [Rhizobium sp. J15]
MSAHIRGAVVAAAAVIAFMAIVPPAAFGGPPQPLWLFLEKFQTLITGIAAVIAAYATVRQMQVTDQAAQRRHNEILESAKNNDREARQRHNQLVELTIRKDSLVAERLLYPDLERLIGIRAQLSSRGFPVLPGVSEVDDPLLQSFKDDLDEYRHAILAVTNMTIQPPWLEAAPLLDGLTAHHLQEMKARAALYLETIKRTRDYPVSPLAYFNPDREMIAKFQHARAMEGKNIEALQEMVGLCKVQGAAFTAELDGLISGLRSLGQKYGL